ncbi:MAG: hypothetical protein RIF37_17960 [Rhodospirillaceae bacterium]
MQKDELDRDEIAKILGDEREDKLVAVISTGATIEEIERAVIYVNGDGDILGKQEHPLIGAAADVYDILVQDDLFAANDR